MLFSKSFYLSFLVSALVIAFAVSASLAQAQGNGKQQKNQAEVQNMADVVQVQAQETAGAEQGNPEKGKAGAPGQVNAANHRSAVANFVKSLLEVADKEGGIGEQVRVVAQAQSASAERTIQAMEKVQTRSKIKTFLIGSDYKNLGSLRSETVQTRNRLEQLNQLMTAAQDEADKTELQNQIQALEQEQVKVENFIKAQESKISLFGWLAKMFQ